MPSSNSAAAEAANKIRELISKRSLGPGERLPSERFMAQMFGVSRTSVRSALMELQTSGLVEIRAKSGSFVATSDGRHVVEAINRWLASENLGVHELIEFRRSIEPAIAASAAFRRSSEDLNALQGNLTQMQAAINDGDEEQFAYYDSSFHESIARASHNQLFLLMTQTLRDLFRGYRRAVVHLGGDILTRSFDDHSEIMKAITAGDKLRAYEAMVQHIVDTAVHFEVVDPDDPYDADVAPGS